MAIVFPVMIVCMTMIMAKFIFCVFSGIDFELKSISTAQFVIVLRALVAEEIG